MIRNITIRAAAVATGLMVGIGSALAQDQPAPPPPQPLAQQAPVAQSEYVEHGSGDCDCLRCRMCYPWVYLRHDLKFGKYYIRGNGPAIHTRPAAIYWW